jgi:hypothetical protein
MRRTRVPFVMALLLAAGACGPAQVVVTMQLSVNNPEGGGTTMQPLPDIEVELLPFDRDAVFDSLTKAFPTPEPAIPQELLDAREEVAQAQQRWQQATNRWNTLRDTLQKITTTMQQYSRGESRYVALFREFQEFDSQLGRTEREMDQAFKEFDDLQKATIRQSDSIRILKENWADEAFADVSTIFIEKARASGLEGAVDTTDANGVARNHLEVKPGKYWLTARYELPYTELYWNVPIDVQRGEPNQVTLSRENAEERVKL